VEVLPRTTLIEGQCGEQGSTNYGSMPRVLIALRAMKQPGPVSTATCGAAASIHWTEKWCLAHHQGRKFTYTHFREDLRVMRGSPNVSFLARRTAWRPGSIADAKRTNRSSRRLKTQGELNQVAWEDVRPR